MDAILSPIGPLAGILTTICIGSGACEVGIVIGGAVITVVGIDYIGGQIGSRIGDALVKLFKKQVPTVEDLRNNRVPAGPPVIVPSTNTSDRRLRGGTSIEQEYVCADGSRFTIHTLITKDGKVIDEHSRPDGPKYGKP